MATSSGVDQVLANLDAAIAQIVKQSVTAMEQVMTALEGWAKSEHSYTDRTSNTTNSIRGFVDEVTPSVVRGILSAGMEYDVFLELAREGKWAFLLPTLLKHQDDILKILSAALGAPATGGTTSSIASRPQYAEAKERSREERRADVDAARKRESEYRQAARDRRSRSSESGNSKP